jgi:Skp family chaperone for outer membrane proteins
VLTAENAQRRNLCALQDEARRLAEQVHALEDARNRWNAELAAREAGVSSKEEALAADVRQKDADQRRRLAQEQQVRAMTLHAD